MPKLGAKEDQSFGATVSRLRRRPALLPWVNEKTSYA